jgi:hypothetical protein
VTSAAVSAAKAWLVFLILIGCVPFFDGLTHGMMPEGFHPRHNVQLGWKLMHILPALAGIGLGILLMRDHGVFAGCSVAVLGMQVVLGLADYWRVGFNPRVERQFEVTDYLIAAATMAVPFAIYSWYLRIRPSARVWRP